MERTPDSLLRAAARGAARGSSIVELMVSTVLFTVLLGVIYSAFTTQIRIYSTQTQLTETMMSARAAAQMLTDQIALAGYGVPSATTPATAAKLLTATASTLSFLSNVSCVQSFLRTAATKSATTVAVVSSTGFAAQDSIYITDGTNWYAGTVGSTNGNNLNVTPALTYAFGAGSTVNHIDTVTFTLTDGQLMRNKQVFSRHVTALGFTYDAVSLAAIRRIGVTLSVQTRSIDIAASQPITVTLSTDIAPTNLGL